MKEKYQQILMPIDSIGLHKIIREINKLTTANESIDYWMIKELAHSERITPSGEIRVKIVKTEKEMEEEREQKIKSQNEVYDRSSDQADIYIEPTKIIKVAKVDHFEIVYKVYEIEKLIKYFQEVHSKIKEPNKMTKEDRKKLVKQLREYSNNLYELESFSKKGNLFLKEDNLIKLEYVFKDKVFKDKIIKWARSIS